MYVLTRLDLCQNKNLLQHEGLKHHSPDSQAQCECETSLSSLSHCLSLLLGKNSKRKTGHHDFTLQERHMFAFSRSRDVQSFYRSHPHFKGCLPLPVHFLPASVHLFSHKLNSFVQTPFLLTSPQARQRRWNQRPDGRRKTGYSCGPMAPRSTPESPYAGT